MQKTKLWLYNYFLPVAITVLLLTQAFNQSFELSSSFLHCASFLLILAVAIRLGLVLKNEWLHHLHQKRQLQLVTDYWQKKASLPVNVSSQHHWTGLRVFTIVKKISESNNIYSFYLKPHDGKSLPTFHPGQYITVQIKHPTENALLTRCYSLSDSYSKDYYRISVKKEPQGLVSNYLHQELNVGDAIEAKAPTGNFYLDLNTKHPLVFIAAGVGITPFLSMINSLVELGDSREIHLFYGARNSSQMMMKDYLQELSKKLPHFHLYLCYSAPNKDDKDDYHQGRITIELLRETLGVSNYHYYLCASLDMMQDLSHKLETWGVPKDDIYFESFGTNQKIVVKESDETHSVFFQKSNKSLKWTAKEGSLLEFAEKNAIPIESACRSGQCGMCQSKVIDGDVEYLTEPSLEIETGHCLSCISIPKSELVVDL